MSEEDNNDKQHEPSQKKLDDARKKGEIPRSTDLSVAASYGGVLLLYLGLGSTGLLYLCTAMVSYLEQATELGLMRGMPLVSRLAAVSSQVVGSWLLVPAACTVILLIAIKGFTFSGDKLVPKISRISILSNAKNKFGRSGLFEFAKSFVKLVIYSVCLTLFLQARLGDIASVVNKAPGQAVKLMFQLGGAFFFVAFLVALSLGAVDYLWQYNEHLRKNRMSDKEMRDEQKEAEGDPHMKNTRRQKAHDIAMNQMIAQVPEADVVIVNPEHYAVALKWNRLPGQAPVCVAKGVDEIALKIKEVANEAGVPIHRDPPTARALHATTAVDDEIDPAHYKAVAAAIRFADHIRKKFAHV
ncbi:flagellar type III secretion system protein FlhB [Lentibacter algarum]|uniref:EscU/YscU/HrcU family type III secretion system export apparatus switch protein n=1 Tax=Lentibacter algarum TaxID=576131 RepID=UPI001C0718A7|nr:flagellar type III secretion system protein FlhB [Lentibacter algarum]MBU2981196.1 flagellar type III secretion system protein FlhB [Lentibacter algarum]